MRKSKTQVVEAEDGKYIFFLPKSGIKADTPTLAWDTTNSIWVKGTVHKARSQ